MTVKEYTEKKLKELNKKKDAKSLIIDREKKTDDERALVSKFYTALASGDKAELKAVGKLVADSPEYKKRAQAEGTVGSGTAGGVLVPTTVADSIVSQMF